MPKEVPLLHRAMASPWRTLRILSILAALCLAGVPARAVYIDLSGKIIKPGGALSGASSTALPAALLYDISASGTGASTGSFVYSFGDGDLATNLAAANIHPDLSDTLVNITGKIPVTFCAKYLPNYFGNVPIATGTEATTLIIDAYVKFSIDKKGFVHASATKLSFDARDSKNKRLPFTGAYTITSGGITIEPSAAASDTPEPNIIFPLGHFTWDQSIENMRRGTSKTVFFILKNDGPDTDSFNLSGVAPTGYKIRVFDGRTEITSQVTGVSGYPVDNLPSAGTKLIKTIVTAGSKAESTGIYFYLRRSADPSNYATGAIDVNIK